MGCRNRLAVKLEAMTRFVMCHFMSEFFPLYIVTEYPRSDGTWFSQMLADALNIPFPRFSSQVMHGHYPYHPRLKNDRFNAPLVDRTRRDLGIDDPENIWEHLPRFLEYTFEGAAPLRFSWSEFVTGWLGGNVTMVKYEDMLQDASAAVGRAISEVVGIEVPVETLNEIQARYSFANLAGRRQGEEEANRFLRKGIAGDWKNKFSPETKQVFDHYAGETLMALVHDGGNPLAVSELMARQNDH